MHEACRKWCYLGPPDIVNLSSILTYSEGYYIFTTKLVSYVRTEPGVTGMRAYLPFILGLTMLLVAYGISDGGPTYGSYVLTLVAL